MEQIIWDICTRMDKLEALVRDNSKPAEPLKELIELRKLYKELKAQKEDVEIECFNAKQRLTALKFTNPLPATDIHHKKGRENDLLVDTRYFMAICRLCHARIDTDPEWARSNGYTLRRF